MRTGKKKLFTQILILMFVNCIILLNIDYARQLSSILYFTIMPGIIILQIFKVSKVGMVKRIVLAIGLSLSFLMFYGLFLNYISLKFGYSEPLATSFLLSALNIILLIFLYVLYLFNEDNEKCTYSINYKNIIFKSYSEFINQDKYFSLTIFPIIFPFLSIFGTYLMNETSNNFILILMLVLIPIYITTIIFFQNKILEITYPLSIYSISLSLLLMHGLTSNYLNGRDVHMEYYAARVVAGNLYWSMSNFPNELTACLSTSLLPSIYWSLSGVSILYVYKVLYQIIWATTPVICFLIYKKYINNANSFLASLFFVFQMPFIFDLQSAMRTQIALFFVSLIWLVYFADDLNKINKKTMFLIFMFTMIFSHYSTSYLFFFQILVIWGFSFIIVNRFNIDFKYGVSRNIIFLSICTLFLWYSQITDTTFPTLIRFIQEIVISMNQFFVEDIRAQGTYMPTQQNLTQPSYIINFIVMWITFSLIAIGVFDSIRTYFYSKRNNKKIIVEIEYVLIALLFGIILAAFLILPYASKGYGNNRVYQQLLIILAIFFVIGGNVVSRWTIRQNNGILLILLILFAQFFCATLLIHQIFGVPYSEDLNKDGDMYYEYYLHDQEIASSKWLNSNTIGTPTIHTDYSGKTRILMGSQIDKFPSVNSLFFAKNESSVDGYIYLRYENIMQNRVRFGSSFNEKASLSNYSIQFYERNLIYNNNGSRIYA